MISASYIEQNARLHEARPDYGANGKRHVDEIVSIARQVKAQSILDYGAGKGTLIDALPNDLRRMTREYDPAIPGKDAPPEPADLVTCTDVLEHVEPEYLDAVLDDLRRLTLKCGFFTVCTKAAKKSLPDGRNAHLIIEPAQWWLPKIMERFDLKAFQAMGADFAVIVR